MLRRVFKEIFRLSKGRFLCTPKVISLLLRNWKVVCIWDSHKLLSFSLRSLKFDGLICEFGVFEGRSINHIASYVPKKTVYGFDSFKGLPEDWYGTGLSKGAYMLEEPPKVRENVVLIVGLFQETLELFLGEHKEKVAFLHMDADLYSSTKYVLDILFKYNRIQKGTIIQFNEYYSINAYESWTGPSEYTAFQEFINNNNLKFKYLKIGPTIVSVEIVGETEEVAK